MCHSQVIDREQNSQTRRLSLLPVIPWSHSYTILRPAAATFGATAHSRWVVSSSRRHHDQRRRTLAHVYLHDVKLAWELSRFIR